MKATAGSERWVRKDRRMLLEAGKMGESRSVVEVDSGSWSPYGPPVNSEQVPPSLRFGAFYLSFQAFSHVQHNSGGCPMGR
jgi:hypothetical protein